MACGAPPRAQQPPGWAPARAMGAAATAARARARACASPAGALRTAEGRAPAPPPASVTASAGAVMARPGRWCATAARRCRECGPARHAAPALRGTSGPSVPPPALWEGLQGGRPPCALEAGSAPALAPRTLLPGVPAAQGTPGTPASGSAPAGPATPAPATGPVMPPPPSAAAPRTQSGATGAAPPAPSASMGGPGTTATRGARWASGASPVQVQAASATVGRAGACPAPVGSAATCPAPPVTRTCAPPAALGRTVTESAPGARPRPAVATGSAKTPSSDRGSAGAWRGTPGRTVGCCARAVVTALGTGRVAESRASVSASPRMGAATVPRVAPLCWGSSALGTGHAVTGRLGTAPAAATQATPVPTATTCAPALTRQPRILPTPPGPPPARGTGTATPPPRPAIAFSPGLGRTAVSAPQEMPGPNARTPVCTGPRWAACAPVRQGTRVHTATASAPAQLGTAATATAPVGTPTWGMGRAAAMRTGTALTAASIATLKRAHCPPPSLCPTSSAIPTLGPASARTPPGTGQGPTATTAPMAGGALATVPQRVRAPATEHATSWMGRVPAWPTVTTDTGRVSPAIGASLGI